MSSPPTVAKVNGITLKVAGALSGSVFVDSMESKVESLRAEVARLLGVSDAATIRLILAGKNLQDSQTLRSCGVVATSRILVTRGASAGTQINPETEKQQRLDKVKRVVESLAGKAGRGSSDDYELTLENQAGSSVRFKPEDQRALIMGLTMHERGKASMAQGRFPSALEELLLAEECFSLCDPGLTAGIDNVGMLLLDLVWCAYKLEDVRRLAVCRERLTRAREALHLAYGPQLERARQLHGSEFCPEMATFARLEAMEGVVAYYQEEWDAAGKSMTAAQDKIARLRVSDSALTQLQALGYSLPEARRGLRFSGNDVDAAVDFIMAQRKLSEERQARRKRQAAWAKERSRYKCTASRAWVEVEPLDALCGMGYDKALAAEALRQHENNTTAALEALLHPGRRAALALAAALVSAEQASETGTGTAASEETVALAQALAASMTQALQASGVDAVTAAALAAQDAGADAGAAEQEAQEARVDRPSGSGSSSSLRGRKRGVAAGHDEAPTAPHVRPSESDEELEKEILADVKKGQDPMDAYDVELEEEAKIVSTFLALLQSRQ